MSAVPAYAPRYEREQEFVYEAPYVSVVPGGRAQEEVLSPGVILAAKIVAVALVALSLVAFALVALNAATVTTSIEANEYDTLIDQARSSGSELEVEQAKLTNPTRIKSEATALGLSEPEELETIVLSEDVVATDDAGNLSLATSIAIASAQ